MAKDPGPFSSILDYEKEDELLRQRKEKQQASQQKIMKTNALGEAFRIIADAIGGSQGATIAPRAVNAGIVNAADRMRGEEEKYNASRDRLRLQSLDLAAKDKGYELDQEAEQARRTFEAKQTEDKNKFAAEQGALDRASREKISSEDNASRERQVKTSQEGQIERANIAAQNRIDQITERARRDVNAAGGFYSSRFDDPTQVEVLSRETVISQFDEIRKILKANHIYPGSSNYPKVLEQQNKGKISDNDLDKIVQQFPDVYGKLYPQLYGPNYQQPQQRVINTPLLPGYQAPAPGFVPYNGPMRGAIQPAQAIQQPAQNTLNLKETDISSIDNVLNAPNYTKEQKRSAVWSYLIKQGYPDDYARKFAEYAYSQLN